MLLLLDQLGWVPSGTRSPFSFVAPGWHSPARRVRQALHELLPALISVGWEGLKVLLNPASVALGRVRVQAPPRAAARPRCRRPAPSHGCTSPAAPSRALPAPPPLHVPPAH